VNSDCDVASREGPLAALWTAPGRGAVATIRLQRGNDHWPGIDSLPFRAANGKTLRDQATRRVIFGRWGIESAEDVVLSILDERTLEIHCHGGEAAASRILADCTQAGFRVVTWNEMVRTAQGMLDAELLEAISRATTLRTAEILLEQSGGVLRTEFEAIGSVSQPKEMTRRLDALLRWANFGLHLTRPWKVVLAGRPNVGKSSLGNAILGYTRSIVFDQPGTTRDVVTATTAIDGWPIEICDTAGLREDCEPLEEEGIERALAALAEADLPVLLMDMSAEPDDDDSRIWAAYPSALVVAHKCDLPQWEGWGAWESRHTHNWVRVSSKTGEGVEGLLREISARLVPEVPPPGTPVPVTMRQVSLLRVARESAQRNDSEACQRSIGEIIGNSR
jgi:tRNA modification GTPase